MPKGLRGEKRPADVIGMRTEERDPWKSVAAKLGARGGKARADARGGGARLPDVLLASKIAATEQAAG